MVNISTIPPLCLAASAKIVNLSYALPFVVLARGNESLSVWRRVAFNRRWEIPSRIFETLFDIVQSDKGSTISLQYLEVVSPGSRWLKYSSFPEGDQKGRASVHLSQQAAPDCFRQHS